eukprot:823904-Pyramimonas_sp.AAC.1
MLSATFGPQGPSADPGAIKQLLGTKAQSPEVLKYVLFPTRFVGFWFSSVPRRTRVSRAHTSPPSPSFHTFTH